MEQVRGVVRGGRRLSDSETADLSPPAKLAIKASHLPEEETKPRNDLKQNIHIMTTYEERLALFQQLGSRNFSDEKKSSTEEDPNVLKILREMYLRKKGLAPSNGSSNFSFSLSNDSAQINMSFGIALMILGCIAVLLNLMILTILGRHRRHVLKHAFYMLICNFAFIDSLKGFCLVLWAAKTLVATSDDQIFMIKIEQVTLIILRFANLGTILNLLMITLNEFIFIKFPLQYQRWVTKRRILFLVLLSWVLSMCFTLLTTFARSKVEAMRIVPCPNSTLVGTGISRFGDKCVKQRKEDDSMPIHNIFTFTLIGFCVLCLLVVVVCYAIFFRIIYRIRKEDARLVAETNANRASHRRRSSQNSCPGKFDHMNAPTDERKIKKQLLRRSKYVLVIGSVIFIYILYLFSYGTIQVLQILTTGTGISSLIIRWSFRILIGLHSIFQPLCYFRMTEFRQFVNKSLGYPCQRRNAGGPSTASEGVSFSEREHDHLIQSRPSFRGGAASYQHGRGSRDVQDRSILLQNMDNNGFADGRKKSNLNKKDSTFSSDMSTLENLSEKINSSTGHRPSVQFSTPLVDDSEFKPLYV